MSKVKALAVVIDKPTAARIAKASDVGFTLDAVCDCAWRSLPRGSGGIRRGSLLLEMLPLSLDFHSLPTSTIFCGGLSSGRRTT